VLVNASVSYRVLSSRNCLELGNKGSPFHWMLLKLMEVQVMYIEAVILCSSMLCFHAVEQDFERGSFFCFLSLWVGYPLVWVGLLVCWQISNVYNRIIMASVNYFCDDHDWKYWEILCNSDDITLLSLSRLSIVFRLT
jgi:hypothetical protein